METDFVNCYMPPTDVHAPQCAYNEYIIEHESTVKPSDSCIYLASTRVLRLGNTTCPGPRSEGLSSVRFQALA